MVRGQVEISHADKHLGSLRRVRHSVYQKNLEDTVSGWWSEFCKAVFKLIFHHLIVLDDILTVPAMRDYIQHLRSNMSSTGMKLSIGLR